jgi:hypothetical protein
MDKYRYNLLRSRTHWSNGSHGLTKFHPILQLMESWRMVCMLDLNLEQSWQHLLIGPFTFNIHLGHMPPKLEQNLKPNGGTRKKRHSSQAKDLYNQQGLSTKISSRATLLMIARTLKLLVLHPWDSFLNVAQVLLQPVI